MHGYNILIFQLLCLITAYSCPDKSEALGFLIVGMKFDVVTQWVIAYGELVIYSFAGIAVAVGKNGANIIQLHAEVALALSMGRKVLRKSHLTKA